ncbi:sugar ABC transporter permease [Clostridium sardiniense]|uniref:Sugar ABC transporter permease n=1 Tax=Clostridium sardiniense TaxID=29369 RepID=A0ABS7L1F3_CLOSR|nr:sugar ABC transporter permease [Clostridium sardiniense]MBY0756880.1 sugar ABC transporter permease [Clostridium sardiniense]MDQ0458725.1 multiple sugar transport system permease protein [Clostridium sardiniense]
MKNSTLKKERKIIFIFLFFPILLLILFGFLPIISLISYSFTSWNGLSTTKEFVGFDNFIKILTDPSYIEVFKNSLYYFVSGILQIIIGLTFAIILSFKVKFKGFFKAAFVFPCLISGVAISMMFRVFFSPDGTFDQILTSLGLADIIHFWLGDPRFVNYTLASISLWRFTGMSFIMYFGAIQSIPKEYLKCAEIEGASILQKVRYVILPNIHTVIKINFILLIVGSISVFEIPMIMTNGSNGTSTFLLMTMKTAFEKKQIGLAASMAVIITILIVVMTLIQKRMYRNDEDEY